MGALGVMEALGFVLPVAIVLQLEFVAQRGVTRALEVGQPPFF